MRTVADSGLSRAAVPGHHDAVASIYRLALEESLVDVNPCTRIPRPKVLRELQHREVLTVPEYAAYLTRRTRLRRTVGTVGLNQGIPLRDVQQLLRHARPETTLASYDISPDALERHASHQVAGFLAGWASRPRRGGKELFCRHS